MYLHLSYLVFNRLGSEGWLFHGRSPAILICLLADRGKRSPFKPVHLMILSSQRVLALPPFRRAQLCLVLSLVLRATLVLQYVPGV